VKHKNIINYCLFAAIAVSIFSCNQPTESNETAVVAEAAKTESEPVKSAPATPIDKNKFLGNWTRTDAPYNLKITGFADDGSMKAEYFNPKSIHVGKATWINTNGIFNIYVELRDENYPGSNYTLFYMADKDLLAGKYFQAVEGATYDVGFMRAK
jgi:hypothetical protein